ncbi:MAG: nickel-dependent lactate racemase, partial [Atopobiaceae bacterium]|nr:nickel-dependent lactate racemase [Atopobiaceae bacterium]
MKTIALPYGHASLDLHVEEEHLGAVVETRMGELEPDPSEEELVRQALANPIGTPRLRNLARDKDHIVLVTSDHTRAVPSRITLPLELEEIRSGNPDAQVTILIATGLHRVTTEEEQRRMFGDAIVDNEHIVCTDAFDPTQFTDMETLPSGASFKVNHLATECDLLICEGFIEPHFFAGFSGGRKSIL